MTARAWRWHPPLLSALLVWAAAVAGAAPTDGGGRPSAPPAKREAPAQEGFGARCPPTSAVGALDRPLPHLAARLRAGLPVTIVTIGSSSTAGAGATSIRTTYPARLGVELLRHFPGHVFRVINSGVNGEEVEEMLRRFETQVFSYQPDLVIWQLGTNALMRQVPLERFDEAVHTGLGRIQRVGADAVLMDLQYAPAVLSRVGHVDMLGRIQRLADEEKVAVYHRFEVMRAWAAARRPTPTPMIGADGLHQNDRGYHCVAADLARALADAVRRTPLPARP